MNAAEYRNATTEITRLKQKLESYEKNQNEKMKQFLKQFEVQEAKLV